MLIRFWVSNYRCFRGRTVLDLTDKKNYSYGKDCIRGDFLDKIVLLGDNGAGKTSFGYALMDIITTLTGFSRDVGQCESECFLNGDTGHDRATFHYEFVFNGSFVEYEYAKTSPFDIISERLVLDRNVIFDYNLSDMSCAVMDLHSIGLKDLDAEGLGGPISMFRRIGESSRLSDVPALKGVWDFAQNSVYYRAMWRMDEHIGIMDDEDDVCRYVLENGLLDDLQLFLRGECGVDIDLAVKDGDIVIPTRNVDLPFIRAASRGTILLARLYCWNRRSHGCGALMFLDDFDGMFHYRTSERVMEHIIRHTKAQCIFVTHNVDLISDDALRPDCCMILEGGNIHSLSSLTNKSIRRGHNLSKMLRDGEFDCDDNRSSVRLSESCPTDAEITRGRPKADRLPTSLSCLPPDRDPDRNGCQHHRGDRERDACPGSLVGGVRLQADVGAPVGGHVEPLPVDQDEALAGGCDGAAVVLGHAHQRLVLVGVQGYVHGAVGLQRDHDGERLALGQVHVVDLDHVRSRRAYVPFLRGC